VSESCVCAVIVRRYTTMSTEKPLPFIYQFAAGAVAGVSEVWISTWSDSAGTDTIGSPQILVMYARSWPQLTHYDSMELIR
jgi:hypothetical protein